MTDSLRTKERFSVHYADGKTVWDDDFGYDASIKISGDFGCDDLRYEYALAVAAALNAAAIPVRREL